MNTQEKALSTCDGVIEITKNEMLVHGIYVSDNIRNRDLKARGSICGGRQACLVGSVYVSYGVGVFRADGAYRADFPGFSAGVREDFMRNRPGLRLAYNAINEAARRYALKGWPEYVATELREYGEQWEDETTPDEGWGEWFFEDLCKYNDVSVIDTREHIVKIVRNAKRLIKTGVVA